METVQQLFLVFFIGGYAILAIYLLGRALRDYTAEVHRARNDRRSTTELSAERGIKRPEAISGGEGDDGGEKYEDFAGTSVPSSTACDAAKVPTIFSAEPFVWSAARRLKSSLVARLRCL